MWVTVLIIFQEGQNTPDIFIHNSKQRKGVKMYAIFMIPYNKYEVIQHKNAIKDRKNIHCNVCAHPRIDPCPPVLNYDMLATRLGGQVVRGLQ